MINRLLKFSIVAFTISFISCNPHFYQPRPLEPALLTEIGQLKINTISDNMNAVSVAYSPKQNLGLQIGVSLNHNKTIATDGSGRETKYLDENRFNPNISGGYYKKLSSTFLFETYGGIGLYNYRNSGKAYLLKMNSSNLFIQPSIVFIDKNIEFAFTIRVDNLSRGKTILSDSVLTAEDQKKYMFLNYKSYYFIQPGLTFRFGTKNYKAQFQISESIPFSNNYRTIYGDRNRFISLSPFSEKNKINYSLGLNFCINNLLNAKK